MLQFVLRWIMEPFLSFCQCRESKYMPNVSETGRPPTPFSPVGTHVGGGGWLVATRPPALEEVWEELTRTEPRKEKVC